MHMRIKYHFLANLHVTRRAWNTSVSGILFNKPCRVELIVIIGHKQHQGTHFLYTIEDSPMDFSREAKHRRILTNSNISRGEKLHEVWVIVLCGRFTVENAFPNIVTFSICYWFISLVILVNEGDFSRPAPTRFSPLLFMFLWILFLTKYDKIM